jgi:hypothetical protein
VDRRSIDQIVDMTNSAFKMNVGQLAECASANS